MIKSHKLNIKIIFHGTNYFISDMENKAEVKRKVAFAN